MVRVLPEVLGNSLLAATFQIGYHLNFIISPFVAYLFNTLSKSTFNPNGAMTTKCVARERLLLTWPPPLDTSSFILLNASSVNNFVSEFLQFNTQKSQFIKHIDPTR